MTETDVPMKGEVSDVAMKVLSARYFAQEKKETKPEDLFRRVSGGKDEYFHLMNDLVFLPNSPTLFNMGLENGCTLSACFVFDVDDTLLDGPRSIMATQAKAAAVAKAGGGVGYYFGNLRPKGAPIRSVHREACGPVAALRHYHSIRNLIKQGARRDLAQMGVLNADHPDIREWIHCKDEDPKALESFNISVSWRDAMLKKVDPPFQGSPKSATAETDLWHEQCQSAWKTGDPGMLFWDAINRANATPHLGNINATNPCGETPNLCDEPCNLGSLAVCRFLKKAGNRWDVMWDLLRDYARLATRFLDDILDWNQFPHADIDQAAKATRKLGLGVMGWADMLAILGVPYASSAAIDLAHEVMGTINQAAMDESMELAGLKGPYPAWESGDPRLGWKKARNSTRTSIAPTGTISLIANVFSSIEPYFAFDAERTTNEGMKLKDGVPEWVKKHIPNGHTPELANQIPYQWHVRHQAAFQRHTDLGVSKTINMPNNATVADISKAYHMMWKEGCKGGTIYRDGCRTEQVLVSKDKKSVYTTSETRDTAPARRKLPAERKSLTKKFRIGGTKGYATVGLYEDGTPGEVFITVDNMGSTLDGFLDSWAKTFSNAIQYGTPLAALVRLHRNSRFDPAGFTGDPDVPSCTSIPDFIVRWMEIRFLNQKTVTVETFVVKDGKTEATFASTDQVVKNLVVIRTTEEPKSGALCPDCGTEMIYQASCLTCVKPGCGFTKCG
jgi:ribonucleoside-diphosphate reductase alpha chain